MIETIRCALRNLFRKKSRTILTISSISIGVASVILISTIGEVGAHAVNNELSSLGIGSIALSVDQHSTDVLLERGELECIRSLEGVQSAIPIMMEYSGLTMRGMSANVAIWGVDAGSSQIISLAPKYGALFSREEIAAESNICLVDEATAKGFYSRENIVGKKLKLFIGGNYEEFSISGVVASGSNMLQGMLGEYLPMFVYIPYTTMQRFSGRAGFDRIAVQVKDIANVEEASNEIVRMLEVETGAKDSFCAENIAKQKEKLQNLMEMVTGILSVIAGISLLVAGLGIMTVMLVNVSERTREIGIKKAIGASRHHIMLEFMAEAFTISAVGSILGTFTGFLIAATGCAFLEMKLLVNVKMTLFVLIFAMISGTVFGVYPSWVASCLKPVDALRQG